MDDPVGGGASVIGTGDVGDTARALATLHAYVRNAPARPGLRLRVPPFVTIAADVAAALRRSQPGPSLDALDAMAAGARGPLVVRASPCAPDAPRPEARFLPNDPDGPDATRRAALTGAIVSLCRDARDTDVAVVVQAVSGARRASGRFYPDASGSLHTFDFFATDPDRKEAGVLRLALGLGRAIDRGERTWIVSPARPDAPPPFASVTDQLAHSQLRFWGLDLGAPPGADPLVTEELTRAETDGALELVASTFIAASERIVPGIRRPGPRVVDFAPLLGASARVPFVDLVRDLRAWSVETLGEDALVGLTVTRRDEDVRVDLLRLAALDPLARRPHVSDAERADAACLLSAERVLGNGVVPDVCDVVYVRPDAFRSTASTRVAAELRDVDRTLAAAGRTYLLIGFGRWGSSDPALGIPVSMADISHARVVVETTLPSMLVEPSDGIHFFHDLASRGVPFLMNRHDERGRVDFDWLAARPAEAETPHVRHVRVDTPLRIVVAGRDGRAGVWHGA